VFVTADSCTSCYQFICICTHKCMLLINYTWRHIRITYYWYNEVSTFGHISILNAGKSDYSQVINSD